MYENSEKKFTSKHQTILNHVPQLLSICHLWIPKKIIIWKLKLHKYSLIQKNGYTFAFVYSSKCVTVFLKQTLPCSTSKSFPTQVISLVKPLGICLCKSLTLISLSLRLSLPNISSQTSLEFTSRLANFNVDSTAYCCVLGSYFNPHPAKLTNSPRKS